MMKNNYHLESLKFRKQILNLIFNAKKGHIGGAYSIIDFLTVLYLGGYLDIKNKSKMNIKHDNFCILSKGHAAISQYVILNKLGLINKEEINNFNLNGSKIAEHPDHFISGIYLDGGSLGHGLGVASGIAYYRAVNKINSKIFIIVGDGEFQEGSIWESLIFLLDTKKIKNLVLVIDNNNFMTLRKSPKILESNFLKNFFKGSNMKYFDIQGHNHKEIANCLNIIKRSSTSCIIKLNTIKGRGISFMENKAIWHHKVPDQKEYNLGLKELDDAIKKNS